MRGLMSCWSSVAEAKVYLYLLKVSCKDSYHYKISSLQLAVNKRNYVSRCRTELCCAALTDWHNHGRKVSFNEKKLEVIYVSRMMETQEKDGKFMVNVNLYQ